MLKALSAKRSYLSHKRRGKKAGPPKFEKTIPVMVRQDCYSLHQLPSGTSVIKFPVSSGRSQITMSSAIRAAPPLQKGLEDTGMPLAVSEYHARRLQDLAGGSCRQGSMEIWQRESGEWYVSISLVYKNHWFIKHPIRSRAALLGSISASSNWPCCPTTSSLMAAR